MERAEKRKRLISGWGEAVVIAVILVAVNLLSLAFFQRWDWTDARLYSLSDSSKQLMRSLDDPVIARCFFTEDLPPPYNANARYLKDQLYEYRVYSGGHLKVEFVDPIKTDREIDAQRAGVVPVQVQDVSRDKIESRRAYMGVAFYYEDRKETLPIIQHTGNLEYEISSAIKIVTAKDIARVGFLEGHGERPLEEMGPAYQQLQRYYRPERVNIAPFEPIDTGLAALVIMGPTDPLSDWEKYAIDQFIIRGGKVAFCLDMVDVDLQQGLASNRELGWDDLLSNFGIVIRPELVVDARSSRIAVVQQQGMFRMQNIIDFPYFPQAYTFHPDNVIVKDLEAVNFPYVSPVDTLAALELGYRAEPLVMSSPNSGIRREPYRIDPMQKFTRDDYAEGAQVLGVVITGDFTSLYATAALPVDTTGEHDPPSPVVAGAPNRMVVIGDSDFAEEQNLGNPSNLAFTLNIVDWLVQDEGLIGIRSREVTSRPLDPVSDGTRQVVKLSNIFAPSLLVIVVGLVHWRTRRRRKRFAAALAGNE